MQCISKISDLRKQLHEWRKEGQKIALVPTMGNLHIGHLSLLEQVKNVADKMIVSIFVNPTQFVEGEDFEEYPRTLDADLSQLETVEVDLVFNPSQDEIYPNGTKEQTCVTAPHLENILCGEFRPGHFAGVALVVTKLFNIVEPDFAVFGEKDYQQLLVIKHLVADLCMPIKIISGPTIREPDKLAVSSRNVYLTDSERVLAPILNKTLNEIADAIINGDHDYTQLEKQAFELLNKSGFKTEYIKIKDANDLDEPHNGDLVVLAAACLGKARLIDNVVIRR
jgi:pantoate--beta-alanine ligase